MDEKFSKRNTLFAVCIIGVIVGVWFLASYWTKGWPYRVPNYGPYNTNPDIPNWWEGNGTHGKEFKDNKPVSKAEGKKIEDMNLGIAIGSFVLILLSSVGCYFAYKMKK